MTTFKTDIIWDDSAVTIIGSDDRIESKLCYTHKSMIVVGYKRKVKYEKVKLFAEIPPVDGKRTIVTYQGLLDEVINLCVINSIQFNFHDKRLPFVKPQFDKMFGLRGTQDALLREFLAKDRSGLCVAPTRYGKSRLIINTLRAYPNTQTIVTAPGIDLLGQMKEEFDSELKDREIKCIYSGKSNKKQSEDITLVSLDSLHHCDVHGTKLILCDEPHAAVTQTRMPVLNNFRYARKFGYGATPEGRFDGCDALITSIFGPPLVEKTFKQAVDEGAILMIKVFMIKIHFEPFMCKDRDAAYRKLIFNNDEFNALVEKISNKIIPKDWQTLIFINNEKQADKLNKLLDCSVGMAKKLNKEQREQLFADVKAEKIKRCICSDIYSTGVTFPDLRCVINCNSGAGGILSTQKPGRLAQVRPAKSLGYMIDFQFTPIGNVSTTTHPKKENEWWSVVNDCKARMEVYNKKEYQIEEITDLLEIKLI